MRDESVSRGFEYQNDTSDQSSFHAPVTYRQACLFLQIDTHTRTCACTCLTLHELSIVRMDPKSGYAHPKAKSCVRRRCARRLAIALRGLDSRGAEGVEFAIS